MNELRKGIAAAAVDDIVVEEMETVTRRYRFSADFIGFSGHFPGDPILPAIAQMRTVVSLAEEHSARDPGTDPRASHCSSAAGFS